MDFVFAWVSQYGYGALFVLLMVGILGLPIPDETILVFCGYLIWKGKLHWGMTFIAGLGGSLCGVSLSYFLGRHYGVAVTIRYGRFVGFTPERLARVHQWFQRVGSWLLTVGYFIPGVRHFTALVAGTSELQYSTFAAFAYSGAAVWVAVFLSIGYLVGEKWHETSEMVHRYLLAGSAVAAALVIVGWVVSRQVRNS